MEEVVLAVAGARAEAVPPPRCWSFSSTAVFSDAESTTGLIGRWIHQYVIATVAAIITSSASKVPHP